MANYFYRFFWRLGTISGCHQMPERSFTIRGLQFPVCARCTGVFLGQAAGISIFYFYPLSLNWISFLLFLMFFDWFLQQMKIKESTNLRRLITGLLCGYGLGQGYIFVIQKIVY